jgi:hypothetical protein
MAVIGLSRDNTQAFLLDYFYDRIAFPDQLDKIREWFLKWRPEMIGIESNAYQRALAQMTARMDGLPPDRPGHLEVEEGGAHPRPRPALQDRQGPDPAPHAQFIDQWVSYDPAKKNGDDDLLDAVEIALGVAGCCSRRVHSTSPCSVKTAEADARGSRVAAGARREEP